MTTLRKQTLTEIEAIGLKSQYDLANGHASYELAPTQQKIIDNLPKIWSESAQQKSRDAENMFKHAFLQLANTPSLLHYSHFKICPTASNSIDIVAAWLAVKKYKTALIEPTFDNLYLILKRRGVALYALPEKALHEREFSEHISHVDAVFIVNPNNPTGKMISRELFFEIITWCKAHNKLLVIDNSFRFFVPQLFDMYELLINENVDFLSLEDTGKVWPTQEIKASLLFTSKKIYREVNAIYDEIFICHSNFALRLLTEFFTDAHTKGLAKSVWEKVNERRKSFRDALDNRILSVHPESQHSTLSVEWIKVKDCFHSDIDCV